MVFAMASPFWQVIELNAALLFIAMSIVAWLAERKHDAGMVDIVWAFGFTPLVLNAVIFMPGLPARKWILAILVCVASIRLGLYLLWRFLRTFPHEDPRYHVLREAWGKSAGWKFWLLFLFQGALMTALSFPYVLIAGNPSPQISTIEWTGIAIFIVGLLGEAMADAQLARFKHNAVNKGKICDTGLWRYSRHPNYFFEWLQWLGLFGFALGAPNGIWTIYAPLLMLHFLTNVTGVAATEAQMLKSKGNAFQHYKDRTSAFVPWFPKQ